MSGALEPESAGPEGGVTLDHDTSATKPHATAPSTNPLENLKCLHLHRVIREAHGGRIIQFASNNISVDGFAANLAASLSSKQLNVYDNDHCGGHLDFMLQYNHSASGDVRATELTCFTWANGASSSAVNILIGTDCGDLLVVEIAWSRVTQCVMGHRGKVTALSSAGRCAVSAAEDETIRIWNTSTMACTAVVDSSVSALSCCGVDKFVTCSPKGVVSLWTIPAADGPTPATFASLAASVGSMDAVSVGGGARVVARMLSGSVCLIQPDGKVDTLMAASKKSVVASGKRGRDEEADAAKGLTGHAIFSSCGQFVIAGDASGVLTVFDAETRAKLQTLSFPKIVGSVCGIFVPTNFSTLVFATSNGIVWRWDLPYLAEEANLTVSSW